MVQLYNEDCFAQMQQMITDSITVDAIICDPPYAINYADWDKDFNMTDISQLCYDLLKPNGNLILFQGWSNVARTKEILDKKFEIQNWIAWIESKVVEVKRI